MLIGIYGASGFGREVLPLVRREHESDEILFIDDGAGAPEAHGVAIVSYNVFRQLRGEKVIAYAIADAKARAKLAERGAVDGIAPLAVTGEHCFFGDANVIGEGAIFCSMTQVTSNVSIGRQFHCNIYSYVAHDCAIGDFVTFAPAVKCNGHIEVGDGAYIGTGAILRQGTPDKKLRIGAGATVGMGAVVTKDVAPGATVVGNPARLIERR